MRTGYDNARRKVQSQRLCLRVSFQCPYGVRRVRECGMASIASSLALRRDTTPTRSSALTHLPNLLSARWTRTLGGIDHVRPLWCGHGASREACSRRSCAARASVRHRCTRTFVIMACKFCGEPAKATVSRTGIVTYTLNLNICGGNAHRSISYAQPGARRATVCAAPPKAPSPSASAGARKRRR